MSENEQKALEMFKAAARKFIGKVESGRTRSVETYHELGAALALAEQKTSPDPAQE